MRHYNVEDDESPIRCAKCSRDVYEKYTSIMWQSGETACLCRTCSGKLNGWLTEEKEVGE